MVQDAANASLSLNGDAVVFQTTDDKIVALAAVFYKDKTLFSGDQDGLGKSKTICCHEMLIKLYNRGGI